MVSIVRRTEPRPPSEPFLDGSKPTGDTLGDLWQWALSDLDSNTTRGMVAEFIVGRALGCTEKVRDEWRSYDLLTPDGIKVEVKAGAFKQAWFQKKDSLIRFVIEARGKWVPERGEYEGTPRRHADVYVFCVLKNRDPQENDPLDLSRWEFYVVSTALLDKECLGQKTIGFKRVRQLEPLARYVSGLAEAVRIAAREGSQ